MYFNLTAFCIDSSRSLTGQYLIRDHMVFHYNRILSAKGKNVHVWMNCVPLDLAQSLRIGSYQEGMSWIVGRLLFFLFLTQTGVNKEMWLLLNNTFVLLRWEVLYENIFLKCYQRSCLNFRVLCAVFASFCFWWNNELWNNTLNWKSSWQS